MALITDRIEFIRFLYRCALDLVVKTAGEDACKAAACAIGDHRCDRSKADVSAIVYGMRRNPHLNRLLWSHAQDAIGFFRVNAQSIVQAMASTNYDLGTYS